MITNTHNTYTNTTCQIILSRIRKQDNQWKQIFSSSINRVGWTGWPQPDFLCEDLEPNKRYALEFKPPNQTKREYLTGLGQCLAYLNAHNYSGLVLPEKSDDGFEIANFVKDLINSSGLDKLPISLYSYDEKTINSNNCVVNILHPINKIRDTAPLDTSSKSEDIFWCWWRENSPYEIIRLLELSREHSEKNEDIYTNYVWPTFWDELTSLKSYTWENKARRISKKNKTAHKQNWKIPLNQLGLHNPDDGKITGLGRKLLSIGEQYGKQSEEVKKVLSQLVLLQGKHLELIILLENFQRQIPRQDWPMKQSVYVKKFEFYLIKNGFVSPPEKRKPTLRTTNAKNSYIRDEFKLWNKFGFLIGNNKSSYDKNKGYTFSIENISNSLKLDTSKLFE